MDGMKIDELEDISLEHGKADGVMEELEELRLVLNSWIKKDILQELLELRDELNKEPKYTEMYTFFNRQSLDGRDCKYAILAIEKFKKERLDKTKGLISSLQEKLLEMK